MKLMSSQLKQLHSTRQIHDVIHTVLTVALLVTMIYFLFTDNLKLDTTTTIGTTTLPTSVPSSSSSGGSIYTFIVFQVCAVIIASLSFIWPTFRWVLLNFAFGIQLVAVGVLLQGNISLVLYVIGLIWIFNSMLSGSMLLLYQRILREAPQEAVKMVKKILVDGGAISEAESKGKNMQQLIELVADKNISAAIRHSLTEAAGFTKAESNDKSTKELITAAVNSVKSSVVSSILPNFLGGGEQPAKPSVVEQRKQGPFAGK